MPKNGATHLYGKAGGGIKASGPKSGAEPPVWPEVPSVYSGVGLEPARGRHHDLILARIQPRSPPREAAVRSDMVSAAGHENHILHGCACVFRNEANLSWQHEICAYPDRVIGEDADRQGIAGTFGN